MKLKLFAVGLAMTAMAGSSAFADCVLPDDAQAGKSVSNTCKSCHIFDAAKPSSPIAPNLHEVYGTPAGSRKDFKYSDAMTGAADKGVVWNDTSLFDYLDDPKVYLAKINGSELRHLMTFHLTDEQKRHDIIAFLKAIKGKPDCK